jgi:hypothetical protein
MNIENEYIYNIRTLSVKIVNESRYEHTYEMLFTGS